MATKKQPATRWHDGTTPIEELAPTEQIAHEVVVGRRGTLESRSVRLKPAPTTDEPALPTLEPKSPTA
jgi:hypothetical protein